MTDRRQVRWRELFAFGVRLAIGVQMLWHAAQAKYDRAAFEGVIILLSFAIEERSSSDD